MLAFVSTANAGLLAASRYPLGLSRDGLFPGFLGRVSKRSGTPPFAIIATGAIMMGTLAFDLDGLDVLAFFLQFTHLPARLFPALPHRHIGSPSSVVSTH